MGLKNTRKVHVPADGSDTFSGSIVSAEWPGGMYVDLFFGGHSVPIEVINVLSDDNRSVDPRVHTPAGLREIVREWITATSEGWPEWYSTYAEYSA